MSMFRETGLDEPAFHDSLLNNDLDLGDEKVSSDDERNTNAEKDDDEQEADEEMEVDRNTSEDPGTVVASTIHLQRGRGTGVGRKRGRGRGTGQGNRSVQRRSKKQRNKRGHRGGKEEEDDWKWTETFNDDSTESAPPPYNEETGPTPAAQACSTPIEFLKLILTDELIELIVTETNVYAIENGCNFKVTKEEVLAFLGLNIAMGIVGLPELEDYWTREPLLHVPWFPSVMSSKKFKAISRFLHFTDNSSSLPRNHPDYDKLWKVRPVIDVIQSQSRKLHVPGEKVSVDESMIGTKARLSFLQYMPKKPTKWGVKVWVCADAKTGYIHSFEVYTGKSELGVEHGLAYSVVMHLMEDLMDSGRTMYCDNFYTSPVLFEDLYQKGIYASGTCRSNKKYLPQSILPGEHKMVKGESVFLHSGGLTFGRWLDKRDVLFLSSLYRNEIDEVERRTTGGLVEKVSKPKIITDYNQHMSGVDKADQFMVYYACGRKSLKWYKRIFWRLVDHSILNAFVLYRDTMSPNPREWTQKRFRMELAYSLTTSLQAIQLGQGRRSPSHSTLHRLKGKHFAYYHEERRRCVVCGYKRKGPHSKKRKDTKTKNYCYKCEVHLCHGKCFERYQKLVKY